MTITDLKSKKYLTLADITASGLPVDHIINELQITNPRQIVWHLETNCMSIPTCICGNTLAWHPDKRDYRKFCSKKCTALYTVNKRSDTAKKKYGVSHYSKTPAFAKRVANTSQQKYGASHYSKTAGYQNRVKETNRSKFGVEFPAQLPIIQQKAKESKLEKYGDENFNNPLKAKESKLEKYGDENFNNRPKAAETCLLRYGQEVYVNSEKAKQTIIAKYGSFHPTQQHYNTYTRVHLNDKQWMEDSHVSGLTLGEIAKQLGVANTTVSKYFYKHNIVINRFLKSAAEREIVSFLEDLGVTNIVQNDRTVLDGKELDIYLPDYGIAIEYNGVYWHCEKSGNKHKRYHLNKTEQCEAKGIQLLHIWNTEWTDSTKQRIWKGMIRSRLQMNQRVYARKCELRTLSHTEAKTFFDQNHLAGFKGGTVKLGLFNNHQLVQAIIIGKSRFNKNYTFELIRAATLSGVTVIGGLSKLLSSITESVISYADRRYSSGKGYNAIGMIQKNNSGPNYFYTKDYALLESRNKYQKHKLSSLLAVFDPDLSEFNNMSQNGYDRIWDCGQLVFVRE